MKRSEGNNSSKKKNCVMPTLKYFFPIAWKFRKSYFFLAAFNVIIDAVTPFVNILVLPYLINELLGDKSLARLLTYAAIIVFGQGILSLIKDILLNVLEKYDERFKDYFTEELGKKSMSLDFQLTEDKEALDQIERARQGMEWYSGGIHGITQQVMAIASAVIQIAGVAVIVILNAPLVLLITAVLTAINAVLNSKRNKIEVEIFKDDSKWNRAFGYFSWEMSDFRNGKDIRLYNAKDMMLGKWEEYIQRSVETKKEEQRRTMPYSLGAVIPTAAKDIACYLYLGVLAITGKITIGVFSQMLTSGGTFYTAVNSLLTAAQEIVKRTNYAYEYVKLMEYPVSFKKGDKHVKAGEHTIEFRHVSFAYPKTGVQVLRDINLTLNQGEHLSVVGLNGAGKTTFVKLMCRLYDPTEGEILLDGVNIKDYDYEEYMSVFAPVFQDFRLFSFSVRDNVDLNGTASDGEVIAALERVGMGDRVKTMDEGINTLLFRDFDKDGVEPSGGEQQKIAIARALFKDSPTVILDEPTAALDPIAEYDIYRQFDKLVGGKTAIYISHRLSSCRFCDHIAVFSEGSVKEYGTHESLVNMEGGLYAAMFAAQAEYYN